MGITYHDLTCDGSGWLKRPSHSSGGASTRDGMPCPGCLNCAVCVNCGRGHRPINVCVLAALARTLEDRLEREIPAAFFGKIRTDLWDQYLGPAVDLLESEFRAFERERNGHSR